MQSVTLKTDNILHLFDLEKTFNFQKAEHNNII